MQFKALFAFFILVYHVGETVAFIDGLYCGLDNCYDIIGVTRDSELNEIRSKYRKLARQWHPDRHQGEEEKALASEKFKSIANAYEILKDDDQRNDYNYMLDNPEEYYAIYYRYYRRRVAPQIDVRLVIAVTITLISVFQYWNSWNRYNTALSYAITVPKWRTKATEIARQEGFITEQTKKRNRGRSKDEVKEEEDSILKHILEQHIEISGGYSKPRIVDILWLQMLLSPYYLVTYVCWCVRWLFKFTLLRQEYGEEEKWYLIRRYMGLSQGQFDNIEPSQREDYFALELWDKEKFKAWKEQQEAAMKAKMAESGKYKSYRRWMKKGGAGQITFDED